jgi:hypothetical protein
MVASISTMPELWIATADGRERRFCAHFLTECRTGHEVVIATDAASGEPLGMQNLTTGGAWHARQLLDPEPVGLGATICLIVAVCCVTWFVTMIAFGEPRSRDTLWAQLGPTLCYAAVILAGFAIPARWHRAEVHRLAQVRDDLAKTLERAAQQQPEKPERAKT